MKAVPVENAWPPTARRRRKGRPGHRATRCPMRAPIGARHAGEARRTRADRGGFAATSGRSGGGPLPRPLGAAMPGGDAAHEENAEQGQPGGTLQPVAPPFTFLQIAPQPRLASSLLLHQLVKGIRMWKLHDGHSSLPGKQLVVVANSLRCEAVSAPLSRERRGNRLNIRRGRRAEIPRMVQVVPHAGQGDLLASVPTSPFARPQGSAAWAGCRYLTGSSHFSEDPFTADSAQAR